MYSVHHPYVSVKHKFICIYMPYDCITCYPIELREAKERKKAQANLQRQEEQMAAAVATWNNDILPKWDQM